jgi:hypothetical protein
MLNLLHARRLGGTDRREGVGRTIDQAAAELVDYLLFVDEATLPDRLRDHRFAEIFQAQGPRDSRGGRCAT